MLSTLALLSNLVLATGAYAQGGSQGLFGFFDGRDIDYWGDGRRVHDGLKIEAAAPPSEAAFSGSTIVRAGDTQPFTWEAYQSPQSPEFWDDGGDWIPPRPFREAVASPTPENIAQYLAWQGRKAEALGKFQAALNQRAAVLLPKEPAKPPVALAQAADVPWSEVKIAYFYQTSCPHCRESRESIEAARRLGAQVTFIQLDHQTSAPMHTPSVPYDQGWEETFHIAATPTWILNLRGKTLKHTGALSFSELNRFASLLTKKEDHHEQLSQ